MYGDEIFRECAREVYKLSRIVMRRDTGAEQMYVDRMSDILSKLYGADRSLLLDTPVDIESVRESVREIASVVHAYNKLLMMDKFLKGQLSKSRDLAEKIVRDILDSMVKDMLKKKAPWLDTVIYTNTYRGLVKKYTDYYEELVRRDITQLFCEGVLMYGLNIGKVRYYIERHYEGIAEEISLDIELYKKDEIVKKLEESIEEALTKIKSLDNELAVTIIESLKHWLGGSISEVYMGVLRKKLLREGTVLIPVEYMVSREEQYRKVVEIYSSYGFDTSVPFRVYTLPIDLGVEGLQIIMFKTVNDRDKFLSRYKDEMRKINSIYEAVVDPMSGWRMYVVPDKPYIIEIW